MKKIIIGVNVIVLIGLVGCIYILLSAKNNQANALNAQLAQLRQQRKENAQACNERDKTLSGAIVEKKKEVIGQKLLDKKNLTEDEILILNGQQ